MPATLIRAALTLSVIATHGMKSPAPSQPQSLFGPGRSNVAEPAGTGLTIASRRFAALFGMSGTGRLVGAALLNTVLRRSISTTSSSAAERFDPMIEPWGAMIRSHQPDFLNIGFCRIHEDGSSMTFSDGHNKVEFSVTERHYHPSIVALYTNRHGAYHRVASLMEKLNSLDTRKNEFEAHCALMKTYDMWNDAAPAARLIEGHQACLALKMEQIITFLDTHKATLSTMKPDAESRQYESVRAKASENFEQERRIFQRLWISRHDR